LLNKIFKASGETITDNEDIIVIEVEYFVALVKALDDTDARIVANYIHWRVTSGLLPETIDKMRDIQFEFYKANAGISEPKNR